MASLASQQKAAAIFYAVLGWSAPKGAYDYYGQKLETNSYTSESLVSVLLNSPEGQGKYAGLSLSESISKVYLNIYGSVPSTTVLDQLLALGSADKAAAKLVTDLLGYSGTDSATLASQQNFEATIGTALFPVTQSDALAGAANVQAIYHVLDKVSTAGGTNWYGSQIANGQKTFAQIADTFVNIYSFNTLNNTDFVNSIFQNTYEREPSSAELSLYISQLEGGVSRGQVIVDLVAALSASSDSQDAVAKEHLSNATHVYALGELPALQYQEQISAVFWAIAERGVDAGGLAAWSKLLFSGDSYEKVIASSMKAPEFVNFVGALNGSDFVQYIYTAVHGVEASQTELDNYTGLASKEAIVAAVINDLRNSTSTDVTTVTQQHAFEHDIGSSLLYKTHADLTATAGGGNATGTVNTGASHQISNAETAVLQNVLLNANAASVVNLKFADHLANLTINGTSAATVNLSDNGVNPGVDITVNNGNVILNASSGADDVLVTATAAVATATGDFNLGAGNDSLKWLGNAAVGGANTVGAGISGNGGDGVDTISANFITKNVVMSGNAVVRTATITSNASQFTNFEKIDLAGYIGKATVNTGSTAANHTFDFGLLTGNAVSESSTTGLTNNVVQAATSNIGSQGFVLSGLAEAVKVINAAGGNSAQLEVTGNATAASSVEITFLQNATNHFNVTFDAVSSTDVNAGSLALNSSSSLLLPTVLSTLNIASGGTGSFDNILSLTGTNAQVQNIAVTGDHLLDLTVGSGFSNVRDINASANTGGLDLNSNHAGTGDGIIVQLLNILPLSAVTTALLAPVLTTLGLNGYQLTVEGTGTTDSFNVLGNTTLAGGNGVNTYELKSSTTQAGVTITDFDSTKDKIVDAASALTISDDASGTSVANYGTRASDTLDALLGTLVGGLTNGVIGLLGGILGLGSSNALTAKVGVASVVFGGSGDNASSYVIIDNNDNHTLDANDSVVYLTGQNHQQLLDTLHYA
ncbi:DUF4214 domain-containing protein [Serratia proteamaculans]|uniref:DUF4214 domain-containing protein n=1 Tax=Serratia proteamaculans TaxID=28151 RepID=UPI0039AEC658